MGLMEGGIIGELRKRKAQRDMDSYRDSFVAKLSQAGANKDALEMVSKIKADSPEKLASAIESIQKVFSNTPASQEADLKRKILEKTEIAKAIEQAKLSPEIVEKQLGVRSQEKQQDLQFKTQESFIDIQKQILQKGVDLDATEKQKLVFAEQGAKAVKIAQDLLNDKNFIGAVFQSAGGTIGKLSTAGNTQLRNYNTAIESGIVSYLFANSGAQASDKERNAFRSIYGAQVGDTIENVQFKNKLVGEFFQTAKDIVDPNKVAGLSVTELKGKMNDIQKQFEALGKGGTEEASEIMKSLQERALGADGSSNDTLKKLGLDPSKYELVE